MTRHHRRYILVSPRIRQAGQLAHEIAAYVVGPENCNVTRPPMNPWWSLRIRATREQMAAIESAWARRGVEFRDRRPRGAKVPKPLEAGAAC